MGDEADNAQPAERMFLATALASIGNRSCLPGRKETTCIDCGDEINERRLAALDGPLRCFECQQEYDILISREKNMGAR